MVQELCFLCNDNKGADQLLRRCSAPLFLHIQASLAFLLLPGFLTTRLNMYMYIDSDILSQTILFYLLFYLYSQGIVQSLI